MTRARALELAAVVGLGLATVAVVLPLVLVLGFVVWRGAPSFSLALLTETLSAEGEGGIRNAIVGTFLLMIGTAALALPLGVLAAVHLHEYSGGSRWTRWLRLATMNLAGVPSIVHGLFGVAVFVPLVSGLFEHAGKNGSLLAACCTLAVLVLPTVITASEEALGQVPDSLREASEGLGATKAQTIVRVVLPSALPGILTGVILAMGRAAGETAPILFTGAVLYTASLPTSPLDQFQAIPYTLYTLLNNAGRKSPPALPYATASVLLLLVLAMSAFAIFARAHFRRRFSA